MQWNHDASAETNGVAKRAVHGENEGATIALAQKVA